MCDYCKSNLCLPHTTSECPLKKRLYCSACSQYGHMTKECSVFGNYGGIEPPIREKRYFKPVLDVVDTPHCIRAIITSYGRTPSSKKEQNCILLREIADALGGRLLLHPSK